MSLLEDLKPKQKPRLMDLVEEAGIDVSDWPNYRGGASNPAANPKYCYEWGFLDESRLLVVNLWYRHLKQENGTVKYYSNVRKESRRYEKESGGLQWKQRALRLDQFFKTAYQEKLPIRVIINEGLLRERDIPSNKSSKVTKRMLDPVPWSISNYDNDTGMTVLIREGDHNALIDDSRWSEDELSDTLNEYIRLLDDIETKTLTKKGVYANLAIKHGRSPKAYEYRMQNISHVLNQMGLKWIPGLKPKSNIGVTAATILKSLIRRADYFTDEIVSRTSDPGLLERRVEELIARGVHRKPNGQKKPNKKAISVSLYDRDPQVKAWILLQANGICECCGKKSPIPIESGFFLEVHHLYMLSHGGSDTISNAIAVCPNCHRYLHYGIDRISLLDLVYEKNPRLVRE